MGRRALLAAWAALLALLLAAPAASGAGARWLTMHRPPPGALEPPQAATSTPTLLPTAADEQLPCALAGFAYSAGQTPDGTTLRLTSPGLGPAELRTQCSTTPGCTAFDSTGALKLARASQPPALSPLAAPAPPGVACWGAWVSTSPHPHQRWLGSLLRNSSREALQQSSASAASVFNATYRLAAQLRKQGSSGSGLQAGAVKLGGRRRGRVQAALAAAAAARCTAAAPCGSGARQKSAAAVLGAAGPASGLPARRPQQLAAGGSGSSARPLHCPGLMRLLMPPARGAHPQAWRSRCCAP
jgi:hypothetical protein